MNKLMAKNKATILLLLVILLIISLSGCKTETNEESALKISHVVIGAVALFVVVVGLLEYIWSSKCPHYLEPDYGSEKSKCILMRSLEYPDLNNWYDKHCIISRGEKRCYYKNSVEMIRKRRGY